MFSKDVHHLRLVYFFLTMLLATKSESQMPFQHVNYQKALMQHGTNTKVVQECETQYSNLEIKPSLKSCISWMTTQRCQDGSRAWILSSKSKGCGQKGGSMINARDLNVSLLGDALLHPMFPPITLRHLCTSLLIVPSSRQSALVESDGHMT